MLLKTAGRKLFFLKRIFTRTLVISILAFTLGWQLGHRDYQVKWEGYRPQVAVTNQITPKQANLDFKLFWQTWDLLYSKYIDKKALDPQKLYYGAISGMVASAGDPYTIFLPPQAQKATKEQLSGSFEGVGIQLGYNKDKRLVVIAPLRGTPAEKEGVRVGDYILKINSKDTTNITLPEAVSQIRGPKGSSVTLTLLSEDDSKPHDVAITRDTIIVKSVEWERKLTKSGKQVAWIKITGFNEKTKNEWDDAVKDALSQNVQAVIVDVRNNPGGFLDASVYIASEFIAQGSIVLQEDYKGDRQSYDVVRRGKMLDIPLAILVNKGSASASEILAGAIMDHKRGKVIGEQSFGKGSVQQAEDLPEGTGIHITTAKWLTPNGNSIHGSGITPEIKVESSNDAKEENLEKNQEKDKKDPQLEKALEVLN